MKKAKRQLWAIVVKQIKVGSLITYISTNHPDDGKGAIDYIVGCFAAGVHKLKLKATDKQYLTYMREGIPSGATAEEAVAILTKMTNLRDSLKDTKYDISDKRHSCNLIHMVEERGKAHSNEVRMQDAALADWETAGGVASCGATGPGCSWCSFPVVNGGSDLSQYIRRERLRSGECAHVRVFA